MSEIIKEITKIIYKKTIEDYCTSELIAEEIYSKMIEKEFEKFMHKLEEVLILEFTHIGGDHISAILLRMWDFKDWWNEDRETEISRSKEE